MKVISIVTHLPPAIDGVGDYAWNLAHQLRNDFGIDTHFIVGAPQWQNESGTTDFSIDVVRDRSTSSFLSLLETLEPQSNSIFLHLSPYGYAKWACPFWLVEALETWRRKTPRSQLVTMFHEIYNDLGWPWQHNFWTSALQKHLAARLARVSDHCLTSCDTYRDQLVGFRQRNPLIIPTIPIPSNVGELQHYWPLSKRQPQLVVFGQGNSRQRVYQSFGQLKKICEQLQIKEILDIGPPTSVTATSIEGLPIIQLGLQSQAQISAILSDAVAGLFHHDPQRLAKSSIFAAYTAHGVIPINLRGSAPPIDGLVAGQHYWSPGCSLPEPNTLCDFQKIANQAKDWYQSHNRSHQAEIFAGYLSRDFSSIST
jgi:hypothetical protein